MALVRVVACGPQGHRLEGDAPLVGAGNRFPEHLVVRRFSPATVWAYAFDLANFAGFLADRSLGLAEVAPTDLFDYLDRQARLASSGGKVVALGERSGSGDHEPSHRCGARALRASRHGQRARRQSGAGRPPGIGAARSRNGLLGHVAVRQRSGGGLIREPKRLPESLPPDAVTAFFGDFDSRRDRAMVLAMVLGGLRSAEVQSLWLADVDMGLRRVRVVGKGGKERVVPIDDVFFTECAAYLRSERPRGCRTPDCFVVLRGPTQGQAMTEAGWRKVFRSHRARSGGGEGAAAAAPPHLWDRVGRRWHRPARASGAGGPHVHAHAAIALRGFLDDIWAWGWADVPRRRLVFDADIPRQPDSLPRALPPDIDTRHRRRYRALVTRSHAGYRAPRPSSVVVGQEPSVAALSSACSAALPRRCRLPLARPSGPTDPPFWNPRRAWVHCLRSESGMKMQKCGSTAVGRVRLQYQFRRLREVGDASPQGARLRDATELGPQRHLTRERLGTR